MSRRGNRGGGGARGGEEAFSASFFGGLLLQVGCKRLAGRDWSGQGVEVDALDGSGGAGEEIGLARA